jgi:uncharacterized membrane protein
MTKSRFFHFAWEIHDRWRAVLSVSLGAAWGFIFWKGLGFPWKVASLCGWIVALSIYLALLGIVIYYADAPMTKQRVSRDEPNRVFLLFVLVLVALLGNISVGIILTSVGNEPPAHARPFTVGLTYAMSDVDITSAAQRLRDWPSVLLCYPR